jgi:hypothetical protein
MPTCSAWVAVVLSHSRYGATAAVISIDEEPNQLSLVNPETSES